MLQKAVEHYKAVGRKQAFEDFTGKKAPFFDRDLYVVCVTNRAITANGGFPQYVGMSPDAWKDADGKPLGKAMWDAVATKNEASVEYNWLNPVSKKSEPKISYLAKIDSDLCAVGAYNAH